VTDTQTIASAVTLLAVIDEMVLVTQAGFQNVMEVVVNGKKNNIPNPKIAFLDASGAFSSVT
jgi:hypothetical protein